MRTKFAKANSKLTRIDKLFQKHERVCFLPLKKYNKKFLKF